MQWKKNKGDEREKEGLVVSYCKSHIIEKQHLTVETQDTSLPTFQWSRKNTLRNIVSAHSQPSPLMGKGQRQKEESFILSAIYSRSVATLGTDVADYTLIVGKPAHSWTA